MCLVQRGSRVAVLSVDPSSQITGGSILGDKTRMPALSRESRAFIRPSPAGASRGGLSHATRAAILLCEAAGYDPVLVESVGVGQSETALVDAIDALVLLLHPGGGDELQGIKRGLTELADLVLVNKADRELESVAHQTAADYANALRLMRARTPDWSVPVATCSALDETGVEAAWAHIERYRELVSKNGSLASRRAEQARGWLWSEVSETLLSTLRGDSSLRAWVEEIEAAVMRGEVPPPVAAARVLKEFLARGAASSAGGPPDKREEER